MLYIARSPVTSYNSIMLPKDLFHKWQTSFLDQRVLGGKSYLRYSNVRIHHEY